GKAQGIHPITGYHLSAAKNKTRRGKPAGPGHISEGYLFVHESRYTGLEVAGCIRGPTCNAVLLRALADAAAQVTVNIMRPCFTVPLSTRRWARAASASGSSIATRGFRTPACISRQTRSSAAW